MHSDVDAVTALKADLIRRLRDSNLSAVSRESLVALKTLIRIRDHLNSPTLETATKIVRALDRMEAAGRRASEPPKAPTSRMVEPADNPSAAEPVEHRNGGDRRHADTLIAFDPDPRCGDRRATEKAHS